MELGTHFPPKHPSPAYQKREPEEEASGASVHDLRADSDSMIWTFRASDVLQGRVCPRERQRAPSLVNSK